jgi:hypothetical protein
MKTYRLRVSFDFACEESEVRCAGVENIKETIFLSERSKMRYRPTINVISWISESEKTLRGQM